MSAASLTEACLLMWEQGGFPRGSEERCLPHTEADAPANDLNTQQSLPTPHECEQKNALFSRCAFQA